MSDFQKVLYKLLQGHRLREPFTCTNVEENYRDDLRSRFTNFLDRLGKFKDKGVVEKFFFDNKTEMCRVCDLIIEVLDEYLTGSAGKAYSKVEALFKLPIIKDNLNYLVHDMESYSESDKSLYRVRYSDSDLRERKELFHIPFQMRHRVRTQRYSIAGLPCLYLGTSLYVCWQEMGKPDLNKLYLSRFKVNRNNKVLNFAYSLETLKHTGIEEFFSRDEDKSDANLNVAHIVFFPLLMACSYNRAHENASFHAEYVIPNLLLQWISKEKSVVSGISYNSTKTKQLRNNKVGVNFVFPPNTDMIISENFCPGLSNSFHLTKPVAWQVLDTINRPSVVPNYDFPSENDLEEGFVKNYKMTKFFEFEQLLSRTFKVDAVDAE